MSKSRQIACESTFQANLNTQQTGQPAENPESPEDDPLVRGYPLLRYGSPLPSFLPSDWELGVYPRNFEPCAVADFFEYLRECCDNLHTVAKLQQGLRVGSDGPVLIPDAQHIVFHAALIGEVLGVPFPEILPPHSTQMELRTSLKAIRQKIERAAKPKLEDALPVVSQVGCGLVTAEVDAREKDYEELLRFAANKLKGQERKLVENLCMERGTLSRDDLRVVFRAHNDQVDKRFSNATQRVNPKIHKIGWRIHMMGGEAKLINLLNPERESPVLQLSSKKRCRRG